MAISQEFYEKLHAAALQGVLSNPELANDGLRIPGIVEFAKEVADNYVEQLGGVEPPIAYVTGKAIVPAAIDVHEMD